MEAVAGLWKDIGVNATVQAVTYTDWLAGLNSKGNYHGVAFGDQSGLDPTEFYQQYFGKSDYSHAATDPTMNELVAKLSTAAGAERPAACAAAADYNNKYLYMIPLYGDEAIYAMKGVNWTPAGAGGFGVPYMGNASPA